MATKKATKDSKSKTIKKVFIARPTGDGNTASIKGRVDKKVPKGAIDFANFRKPVGSLFG